MASVLWPETTFFIIAFLRQGSPLDQFEELFTIKALAKLENNQLTSAHLMVAANDYITTKLLLLTLNFKKYNNKIIYYSQTKITMIFLEYCNRHFQTYLVWVFVRVYIFR